MSSNKSRQDRRYRQATALVGLALLFGMVTLPGVAAQAQQEQSAKARRSDESNSANKKKHIYAKSIKKNIELRGAPVTLTLPLMKRFTAKSLEECPPFLNVEGIEYNPSNSVFYEIYINLPKGVTPDPNSLHYAGLLSLYALPQGGTNSIPVTDVVRQLQQRNLMTGDAISVTFVPPPEEGTDRSERVRFKRVTITGE